MFIQDAVFICRKCLAHFYIPKDRFNLVRKAGAIECIKCGITSNSKSSRKGDIERFFRFYPRLVAVHDLIRQSGNGVTGYDTYKLDNLPIHTINSLTLACGHCGKPYSIPFRRFAKLAKEPGSHVCPKCKTRPALVKHLKEFFVCLNHVCASWRIHEFQWDIFSPIGVSPSPQALQWPIYAKESKA